jgi:DAK2 domain fusion protein YloV
MNNIKTINGTDFVKILFLAKDLIFNTKDQINQLNVFPVPDGDTGTNMYLTLESALKNLNTIKDQNIDIVSKKIAKNAVLGGRGNSGVILGQILYGLSKGFDKLNKCDVKEFGHSLDSAVEASYESVSNPVEGTMLTIIKSVSEAWNNVRNNNDSFNDVLPLVCEYVGEVLKDTPNMLEVLKQADVVDAGGQGLLIIFEAMKSYMLDEKPDIDQIMNKPGQSSKGLNIKKYVQEHAEDEWGYCVQLVVNGADVSREEIEFAVNEYGGSTIITGIENYIKIHTHSEDPGKILSACIKYGELMEINIENMDKQFQEFVNDSEVEFNEKQICSIIAISNGNGFNDLFINLGIDKIVKCEKTLNPSVEEILNSIDECQTDHVIILPNEKNAIMACNLAAEESLKNVSVLNTKSIPEGLASMMPYNNELDLNTNILNLENYTNDMIFGAISLASRSGVMNNIEYKEGEYIVVINDAILFAETSLIKSIEKTISHMESDSDSLITVYWGDHSNENQSELENKLIDRFSFIEMEFQYGGQSNIEAWVVIE